MNQKFAVHRLGHAAHFSNKNIILFLCVYTSSNFLYYCHFLTNNNGSIDVKMGGSVLEEKSSFKILGLTFSFKLDWGSC